MAEPTKTSNSAGKRVTMPEEMFGALQLSRHLLANLSLSEQLFDRRSKVSLFLGYDANRIQEALNTLDVSKSNDLPDR